MKKLYYYILTIVILSTTFSSYAQHSYFFNQKNVFSVKASVNPRLLAMHNNKDKGDFMSYQEGIGLGTFYQYYNDENVLIGGDLKYNLMLNTSYGRIFGGNKIIGLEFNYQKTHMTISESSNSGFQYSEYNQTPIPFLISTPVFNVYDIQLTIGHFASTNISPNKHLITFGAGIRMFSLDEKQNYRSDEITPYTDLSEFMEEYDRSYIFARISVNYTYRILITKNLSFDIGVNSNLTLTTHFDPEEGNQYSYGYSIVKDAAYRRSFVQSRLGYQTFFNLFYFRTGLSFAI